MTARVAAFVLAAALLAGASPSRAAAADPARAVARGAGATLERFYVFPSRAHRTAQMLRARASAGAYDGLRAAALAKRLTADIATVLHDVHVSVAYSADAGTTDLAQNRADALAFFARLDKTEGYGIARIAHLPGNVGYIELRMFAVSPGSIEGDRHRGRDAGGLRRRSWSTCGATTADRRARSRAC